MDTVNGLLNLAFKIEGDNIRNKVAEEVDKVFQNFCQKYSNYVNLQTTVTPVDGPDHHIVTEIIVEAPTFTNDALKITIDIGLSSIDN